MFKRTNVTVPRTLPSSFPYIGSRITHLRITMKMTEEEMKAVPDSEPDAKIKAHWRLMDQWERAEDNVAIWTAKLETCKKYLKKWKAKANRLEALVEAAKKNEIAKRSAVINLDWEIP